MTGVYFDNYKQRWMAKIQRANKVIRKGFKDFNDAVNYRKELEKTIDFTTNDSNTIPQNFVRQEEHKNIVYKGYVQEFIETNIETGESVTGKFYVSSTKAKIIHKDNATVVILDDGSKGVAKCNEKDIYSRKEGLRLAYNRAMIEHLLKETSNNVL